MEYLIKDLIEKLSDRKTKEMDLVEIYKAVDIKELLLISSGKIIEIEYLIRDLEEMLKYDLKTKNY